MQKSLTLSLMQKSLTLSLPLDVDNTRHIDVDFTVYLEQRVSADPYCHFDTGIRDIEIERIRYKNLDLYDFINDVLPEWFGTISVHIRNYALKTLLNYGDKDCANYEADREQL